MGHWGSLNTACGECAVASEGTLRKTDKGRVVLHGDGMGVFWGLLNALKIWKVGKVEGVVYVYVISLTRKSLHQHKFLCVFVNELNVAVQFTNPIPIFT